MENNFLEFLESLWRGSIFLSFFLSVFFAIWGSFDMIRLTRYEGKIKRGIKIWKKPLQEEYRRYLSSLSTDVVETRKMFSFEKTVGFIRVRQGEALIRYRRSFWGGSWPYVGYVDLSNPDCDLEFRSSLPLFLFFLPFILIGIFIPFVALLVIIYYRMETKPIENFLERKSKE